MQKLVLNEKFLLANWTNLLDKVQLLRITLEYTRNIEFTKKAQEEIPKRTTQLSITKFTPTDTGFCLWIEFSTPKEDGVVTGTYICELMPNGELVLKQSFGTHFVPTPHQNS